MITNKQLTELYNKTENMESDLFITQLKRLLKSFRLEIDFEALIDRGLDELLEKTPEDLVDSNWETLQKYLLIVSKWKLFIRRQINLREVYSTFIAKRKYSNILRQERIKLDKKKFGSDRAMEEKLVTSNKELELLEIEKDIAEAYFKLLNGFDSDIENMHFVLQNLIKRKELEWRKANMVNANPAF